MIKLNNSLPVAGIGILLLAAGCKDQVSPVAAPQVTPAPAVVAQAPTPSFQPYVLVEKPAPIIKVATPKHKDLRLERRNNKAYLVDADGNAYLAGRDKSGRLYPTYSDPTSHDYYPLHYDSSRDQYYRMARADDGTYYRNYVGDSSNRYYQSESGPAEYSSSSSDQPNILDEAGQQVQQLSQGSSNKHRDDWLWAIPVVVGAYLLLQKHGHSSPAAPVAHPTSVQVATRPANQTIVYRNGAPPIYVTTTNGKVTAADMARYQREHTAQANANAAKRALLAKRQAAITEAQQAVRQHEARVHQHSKDEAAKRALLAKQQAERERQVRLDQEAKNRAHK